MSRVLLAWELGGSLGHVVPMLALARSLRERGHRVVFALRDLSNAILIARERFAFFQAPTTPRAPHRGAYRSYAAMLSGEAFPSVNAVVAGALAWRSILQATRADLLVADHAPLALLAARGQKHAVATFSAPFSIPVAHRPLPVFSSDAAAAQADEEDLLQRLNTALAALRTPRLEAASDLYRVDATMARTLPEIDCFSPRPAADYVSPQVDDAGGAVPPWPDAEGPRVLVYLKRGPWLQPLCDTLAARKASAIACVPGIDAKDAADLERPGVTVVRELCKFSELTQQSDVVVCHGSHNTVTGALLAGKPLVMMPAHVEQALTAARIVALGAGAVPAGPQARLLRSALDAVDPRSVARQRAQAVAERYQKASAPPQILERVEALLA